MIINADILRRETMLSIRQIEAQIDQVKKMAEAAGIQPSEVRDPSGGWVMTPLLLAKVTAYATLVQLQQK